ncbi:MAG TPA: proprotein convertase P-domain-containing protein [Thermoanaerobaculia bacterium]|nr:proprotein convertase P-domain-containing protein [Thermoanaerobaculia bacterium]
MLLAATLVLELTRESLTGTHYRYRQYEHGLPTDTYITTKSPLPAPRGEGQGEGLRFVEGRRIRRRITHEAPYKPWQEDVDAATGALIRRTPLFFNAKPARVFDPNPVVTLNAPDLQDANDGPVPEGAYKSVQLPDSALHGPWVELVDRQLPSIAPPEGSLVFDRTADGFEDVNAYFHIHRNQEWVQSLGYRGPRAIAPYAVPVDAHASAGEDNSFFVPSGAQAGRGTLFFGEGGTDDAEDADILVHEYAHALMEWIAPGTFGGGFGSEARALSEGTADYWAFSAHVDARRASGRDPYCIADWDARCWLDASSERCGYPPNSDCLRRVDSTRTMADFEPNDQSGAEHRNGAIWSSALRELREQMPRGEMDTIVLESIFGLPPRPTFAVMARRLIEADRELYQGAHIGLICTAMGKRGILTECEVPMLGERVQFQSVQHGLVIPETEAGVTSTITISDARAIEKLFVRVDLTHSARGDLRIELIAPDGTVILLQNVSSSRTADIHATYGLTAAPAQSLDILHGRSAAGTWTLRVADRAPQDTGTLLSWGLDIQFAGDQAQSTRPRGARSQMIPVVAHLYGQAGAYVSDVRIANVTSHPQIATLIFTRSTKNGAEEFLATRVFVDAGQTLSFDDVVDRTFHTAGSGSLEILGDVLVMSRTVLVTANGTLGQDVPAVIDTTAVGEEPLFAAPFHEPGTRVNVGITETAGGRGIVSIDGREIAIEPYSHVQLPSPGGLTLVRVISGNARVAAYLSQLRNDDAMFIPAIRGRERTVSAPAITGQGSDTPVWRSDLWAHGIQAALVRLHATNAGTVEFIAPTPDAPGANSYPDVLARLFHRTVTTALLTTTLSPVTFAGTRIVHGATMQYVPFLEVTGPEQQHLLFIESNDDYTTNVGFMTTEQSRAELRIYNAAGAQVGQHILSMPAGWFHVPVVARVSGGRAVVHFTHGSGRAYASLIDRRSGDATFVAGQ